MIKILRLPEEADDIRISIWYLKFSKSFLEIKSVVAEKQSRKNADGSKDRQSQNNIPLLIPSAGIKTNVVCT